MRRVVVLALIAAVLVTIGPERPAAAPSSEILYRVTNTRGSIWRYDYTLVSRASNPSNSAIVLFETFFPYGSAQNIGAGLLQAASGWRAAARDPIAPVPGEPVPPWERADGVYQAQAMRPAKALRPGQSLSGFSVEFEWLGPQPPAEQDYLAIHTFDTQAPSRRLREPVRPREWRPVRLEPADFPQPPGGVGEPNLSYYELGLTRLDPSIPEPGTLALVGGGVLGIVAARWRRRKGSE